MEPQVYIRLYVTSVLDTTYYLAFSVQYVTCVVPGCLAARRWSFRFSFTPSPFLNSDKETPLCTWGIIAPYRGSDLTLICSSNLQAVIIFSPPSSGEIWKSRPRAQIAQ